MSTLSQLRRQQLLQARAHVMRVAPSEPDCVLWNRRGSGQGSGLTHLTPSEATKVHRFSFRASPNR
jgi:hypothetical protein